MAIRFQVTGKVQGVYFRESSRQEAERLGVTGWVQNRPDGSVEGTAEGEPAAVDALVAWLHHGPAAATVEHVVVEPAESDGSVGFTVRR